MPKMNLLDPADPVDGTEGVPILQGAAVVLAGLDALRFGPDQTPTTVPDGVRLDGDALLRLYIDAAGKRLFGLTENFVPKFFNGIDLGAAKLRSAWSTKPLVFVAPDGKEIDFGSAPVTTPGTPVEVRQVVINGQSLSTGAQAMPILSDTASPWGLRFLRGVRTWNQSDHAADPENRAAGDFDFTDISEQETVAVGETIATGMVSQARALRIGFNPASDLLAAPDVIYLASAVGVGSSRLAEVDQRNDRENALNPEHGTTPGGNFLTLVDDVARAAATAASRGYRHRVSAVVTLQGEENRDRRILNRSPAEAQLSQADFCAAYAEDMVDYHDAANTAIIGITGQAAPSIWYQTVDDDVGTAQLRAARQNEDIYVAAPVWPLPSAIQSAFGAGGAYHGMDIHLAADGSRWLGCQLGKALSHIEAGREWKPLQPATDANGNWIAPRISADRKTIWIDFDVPAPPLVIDTAFFAKARGWGLAPRTAGGVYTYPDRIEVENGTRLRLEFDAAIAAGALYMASCFDTYVGQMSGAITAVGAGAAFANGNAATNITVAGDMRPELAGLIDEGAFLILPAAVADGQLINSGTPVREVTYSGGSTILRVETAEIPAGANGTFVAGPGPKFGRDNPFCNVRDSDRTRALFSFSGRFGTRSGRYPLWNWLTIFDHSIEGVAIEEL